MVGKVIGLDGREVRVQVGKNFYVLKFVERIDDVDHLVEYLDKYDVRLLMDK